METVFIERRLELREGGEVIIRFFLPVPGDVDYSCRYRITWPDREREFQIFGIDGVQALLLAMQAVHADLLSSSEGKAGELRWLGDRDLDLPMASGLTPQDFA
jgi:hypothetical protein